MNKTATFAGIVGTLLCLYLPASPAQAQATRTWVSGVGDDANPCSRTAPCKTFAGAISKTAAGGEINALDPGGFGGVTITKAITIDGGGGQVASVLVSGTNGITVAAQPADVVILRNLRIDGLLGGPNAAGLSGINFISGAMLSVENCTIFGFATAGITAAVSANATLNVTNSNITHGGIGISLSTSAGSLIGEVDHTTIQKTSGNGVSTSGAGSIIFTVTNSNILNVAGTAVNSGGTGTVLGVDNSSVSSNNVAFATASGGLIRVSRNVIYDNNTNFSIPSGTIASSGNNIVAVNGAQVPNGTITQQ